MLCNIALFRAKREFGIDTEITLQNLLDHAIKSDAEKIYNNHIVTIIGYNYDNPNNRQIKIKNTWSVDNPTMIIYEAELFNYIMFRNDNIVNIYYIAQKNTKESDWITIDDSSDKLISNPRKTRRMKRIRGIRGRTKRGQGQGRGQGIGQGKGK